MRSFILNRNLQLWKYSPSFSRLLLLANKENIHEDRVALVFQGTKEIHLPTYFFCKSIETIKTDADETSFRLISTNETYLLSALRMEHSKDALEYDAPVPIYDDFFKID